MAAILLDSRTALLVIDLQRSVVDLNASHGAGRVVGKARSLADAFRRHKLPVVLVNVAGAPPGRVERQRAAGALSAGWSELVPELGGIESDFIITKRTWGAFTATPLEQILRDQAVTQVVLTGISTSIGVESTARQAHELGFNVTLTVDAMTDSDPLAHASSIERIFPRLGQTATAEEIIAAFDEQWHSVNSPESSV